MCCLYNALSPQNSKASEIKTILDHSETSRNLIPLHLQAFSSFLASPITTFPNLYLDLDLLTLKTQVNYILRETASIHSH